jgi:arginyl-tRNA synthetase
MLAAVVEDLLQKRVARMSKGAAVIFVEDAPPEVPNEEEDKAKAKSVVRKQDGAFTYTASDLATIRYRMDNWHPNVILYVVGTPQSHHFRVLFHGARRWGYDHIELEHINFGSVLGNDRKILSTRNGGATELSELLDMAVARGAELYEKICQERRERNEEVPDLSPEERQQIAEVVGIGAVKYADLMQNRTSDYVFDWRKMLATDGNTATYMQYAYVRNRGIFRKGEVDPATVRKDPPLPSLAAPQERDLALQLVRFHDALLAAAADYRPSQITGYLWDLCKSYSGFFQNCPVLKAETPELRRSRLLLCDVTARVIQKALDLLGIRTLERM